jgi:phytanoyl-CoA hydroxylase
MKLTDQQLQYWHENGHLAVDNVIPQDLIQQQRQRLDYWVDNFSTPQAQPLNLAFEPGVPPSSKSVRKIHFLENHEESFHKHAFHLNMLDLVEQLIGRPFGLYETQAFLKPPEIGSPKPPHQDNAYFMVTPADSVITCWGAVDDATLENGCMQYYPGSHKAGMIKHEWIKDTPHQVPVGYDLSRPLPVPIKAGGIIFHHSLALHMSLANTSQHARRAFACHYIRLDADTSKAAISADLIRPART